MICITYIIYLYNCTRGVTFVRKKVCSQKCSNIYKAQMLVIVTLGWTIHEKILTNQKTLKAIVLKLLKISRCQFTHVFLWQIWIMNYVSTANQSSGFSHSFQQNVTDVYVKTACSCCELHPCWTATKHQRSSLFMTELHVFMYF